MPNQPKTRNHPKSKKTNTQTKSFPFTPKEKPPRK